MRQYQSWLITIVFGLAASLVVCNVCPSQDSSSEIDGSMSEPCFDLQLFEYEASKKAQQDKDIELECFVRNKGASSVAWLFENQLISLDDKVIKPDVSLQIESDLVKKFTLKINGLDAKHKGSYRCQISTLIAQNLEYSLDVLVPPTISRIPNSDVITVNEGDSVSVQCLAQGNPKPRITWSKRGEKADHTSVDEIKSTLNLQNVDQTHSDTYSCTATNEVGNPVTSEFQIMIKFKPRVSIDEEDNANNSVVYSGQGRKERIRCVAHGYPSPKMSLLHNGVEVHSTKYFFEEKKESEKQFVLVYNFLGSSETFGDYTCLAENELGVAKAEVKVNNAPSELHVVVEKLPVYSDAVVFEWSVLSGSSIQEINVQVFHENNTNGTILTTKTKQISNDGVESQPTYYHDNIQFKDLYDINKLHANTSYTFRVRVRNDLEWSEWSPVFSVKTHSDDAEKLVKHKAQSSSHHHRHHERKHKNLSQHQQQQQQQANLNIKRDRFNSYLTGQNSALRISETSRVVFFFTITNAVILKFLMGF